MGQKPYLVTAFRGQIGQKRERIRRSPGGRPRKIGLSQPPRAVGQDLERISQAHGHKKRGNDAEKDAAEGDQRQPVDQRGGRGLDLRTGHHAHDVPVQRLEVRHAVQLFRAFPLGCAEEFRKAPLPRLVPQRGRQGVKLPVHRALVRKQRAVALKEGDETAVAKIQRMKFFLKIAYDLAFRLARLF